MASVTSGAAHNYTWTCQYQYDAEGNRIRKTQGSNGPTTRYTWDHHNRLVQVTDRAAIGGPATKAVDMVYDMQNRWIGETVDPDGDGAELAQSRHFVYDGEQIVLQFEGDGSSAQLTHRYLWGPAVDQLLADEPLPSSPSEEGNILWALGDQLGTVRDLAQIDAETGVASVANHRTFDAFGHLTSQTNSAVDSLFGFTGRALDEATGLQNNLNRWNDPNAHCWVTQDPTGFAAGDQNLYRYVNNASTVATDPTGLWLCYRFKVHEFITLQGALSAGYKWTPITYDDPETGAERTIWSLSFLKDENGKDASQFGKGLEAGVQWVDMPEGLLGLNAVTNLKLQLSDKNIIARWNKNQYIDTIKTMTGSHQFYHAMVPHVDPVGAKMDWSAEDMTKNVIVWILQHYAAARMAKDPFTQGKELGIALHTLEDSYCPSHVQRDAQGKIIRYQDYGKQDHELHAKADVWTGFAANADGTFTVSWPDPKVQNGYNSAQEAAAKLLTFFNTRDDTGKFKENSYDVAMWLYSEVFVLTPDAEAGGTDPAYVMPGNASILPKTALQIHYAMA